MKKAKKAIALFVIGIIGLVLSGCAVLAGGAVGLATAALTRNDKLGVAAGLATTAAVLGWEKRARAAELAQGTEDCSRQEVIQNGRLVTNNLICNSLVVRPGFRGDPLPHGPRVPQVRYEPAEHVAKPYEQPPPPTAPAPPAGVPPPSPAPPAYQLPAMPPASAPFGYRAPIFDDPTLVIFKNTSRRAVLEVEVGGYQKFSLVPGQATRLHLDIGQHEVRISGWVPTALGPRPIEPRTQRIRIEARGRPQTLSFHE